MYIISIGDVKALCMYVFMQAWLTSATHTFQEVVESYNSSLKSCGNILDSKRQLLDDASVLLNHHLQSL